ncbi:MAG: urea ABC transporter permease subunit UrtB, partial [Notoacmeibacter sp.]|nr:urea ABC transporter permease subunit UrtB [Notoacmeibacter sp.]
MRLCRLFLPLLLLLVSAVPPVFAQDEAALRRTIATFALSKSFNDTEKVIGALAALGDPRAAFALNALSDGELQVRQSDGAVFVVRGAGDPATLLDPVTGETMGTAPASALKKVRVKNSLRRDIRDTVGALTLAARDPAVRMQAAATLIANPDPEALEAVEAAIRNETDAAVRARMETARAAVLLLSDRGDAAKLEAIAAVERVGNRDALGLLSQFASGADGEVKAAAEAAMTRIEDRLALWGVGQNVWYGISLGSVLLLAAIGLAITFGVMGVINM